MEHVILDWYRGERIPARQPLPCTEQSLSLERGIRALERRLTAALTEEQAALYALLRERHAEAAVRREDAVFEQGVRLGVRFTAEALLPEEPEEQGEAAAARWR